MSSSSLSCTRLTAVIAAAILIQITGLVLFVFGFFPVKPALSGVSGAESFKPPWEVPLDEHNGGDLLTDDLRSLYQNLSGVPPQVDRLILMVVDGLPAEFVLGKNGQPPPEEFIEAMPYTHSLLTSRRSIGYHAVAAPPTVTMPRLKALVSGAIGGFLDVAFNFNTQAFLDDNLLGQFVSVGLKMLMFGDETWLKLFPGFFKRYDGVSSFYVKDTVQVDLNVSRHLSDELFSQDWDAMILHYLGLDHIGHIGGRTSDLMIPKLKEMDEVIKAIHLSTLEFKKYDLRHTLLLVVSDHGMTYNGNHGGSSFEETDTLALFVGPESGLAGHGSSSSSISQVDIAPTLALLLGVPIPKNNVGVLISDLFKSLSEGQQLRALELNSLQLLKLLRAHMPGLSSGKSLCVDFSNDQTPQNFKSSGSVAFMLCSSYCRAYFLHRTWSSKKASSSDTLGDFTMTQTAYIEFIRATSDWLSRKASDKRADLIASGIGAMLVSGVIVFNILFKLLEAANFKAYEGQGETDCIFAKNWCLEDIVAMAVIIVLVISMGSSSMVEEEHYIWHFLTATMSLVFLRSATQHLPVSSPNRHFRKSFPQFSSIILLLVSGRLLRGWHQGGVNWIHLPDMSKWLEQAGNAYIQNIQLLSGSLLLMLSTYALFLIRKCRKTVLLIGLIFLLSSSLVISYLLRYPTSNLAALGHEATSMVQVIFITIGISMVGITLLCPWLMPIQYTDSNSTISSSKLDAKQQNCYLLGLRDYFYVVGWAYTSFWCLLQLVLQQAINSFPLLLLFVQVLASLVYYCTSERRHKQWVEIAALYYLGMAGHFSLGNSNTLATIDVAGAFIGISEHSNLLSGTLMFMITYAAPFMVLFSLVLYIAVKNSLPSAAQDKNLGKVLMNMLCLPCLVPLGLNSIILTAYTVVLLQMRNHLFIWSVFSPKYLYVCATTVCIYVGIFIVAATTTYVYYVFIFRTKKPNPGRGKVE